jgi:large subunit ribosomal protein L17
VRHARAGKKLGRDSAHRKALYSNLAGALIEHGRIKTTVTKAKAVKPYAEQMITLGRRGDLHARRQATAFLRSRDVVHKLFADVAPLFKDRPGGYTRIIKIGPRPGDAAEMAYLELVDEEYVERERVARTPEPVAAEIPAEAAEEAPDTEAELVEDPEADAEAEPATEEVSDTTAEAPSAEADDAEPKS